MNSASPASSLTITGWMILRMRQFLFQNGDAGELGLYRILFFAITLAFSSTLVTMGWSSVPSVFWSPIGLFRIFHLAVLPDSAAEGLFLFWKCALAFALLGLFTRIATASAFLSGLYLIGLHQNFGKVGHADAIVVLGLAIFAVSRSGDGLSLDSLRHPMFSADPTTNYAWPLKCFQTLLALVLFSSFLAKIRYSGMTQWIFSDSLYNAILSHYYTHQPPTGFGLFLAAHPPLIHIGAAITLLLEGLSITLPFLPPLPRTVLVLAILVMLTLFWLTLGVLFSTYMALLSFFLPLKQIRAWIEPAFTLARRIVCS